jgi:hypothetical protein
MLYITALANLSMATALAACTSFSSAAKGLHSLDNRPHGETKPKGRFPTRENSKHGELWEGTMMGNLIFS